MDPKFCMSSKVCTCNKNTKDEFFTDLKRFGVHIEVNNEVVTFVCNRTASKGK